MDRKGFTLIEILTAVAIVGILAALAIPRWSEARDRAHVAAMQSDLYQVRTAQEAYYQANDLTYADDISDLTDAGLVSLTEGVSIEITAGDNESWAASATHASADVASCSYESRASTVACSVESADGGGGGASGRRGNMLVNFFRALGQLAPN